MSANTSTRVGDTPRSCSFSPQPIAACPPISNISWLQPKSAGGGAVKWEPDTSLASPAASPKTPAPAKTPAPGRLTSFQRLKSFGRLPAIKKQNVEDPEGEFRLGVRFATQIHEYDRKVAGHYLLPPSRFP